MCAMDSLIRTCVWAVLITGILGKPVSRTNIEEGPNLFVATGSTINLTCIIAESTAPADSVVWFHDGREVDTDSPRGGIRVTTENGSNPVSLLEIQNAGPADTGKYTCQPKQDDFADIWVYVLDGSRSAQSEPSNSTSELSCAYKGAVYPLGAHIYPDEDPCIVCECNSENWNGSDNSSCYRKECSMEKDQHHLDAGCVPVYQERECCPVEYYCPEAVGDSSDRISVTPNEDTFENSDRCYFAGKAYDIGIDIPVNNSCIKCSCRVPPYITCTRQSCPPNTENCPSTYRDNECCPIYNCLSTGESFETAPEDIFATTCDSQTCPPNVENCPSTYRENECCPIYNCLLEDESLETTTEDIYANCPFPSCADKSCVIRIPDGHQCPTCICDANCPTPLCADKSCVIGTPPGHQCPTCICDDTNEENDLEVSHETNDLEPLFEELEPQYIEVSNKTQTLDNEIQPQVMSKNYSERESLSPVFEERISQKGKFAGEEMRSPKSAPKISLLNEEESIFNKTEFELGQTTAEYNSHVEDIEDSTGDTSGHRQKRSGNLETAGIQSSNSQQQWNILQQDQFIEDAEDSGENSERELEGNDEDFAEMKILSTKNAKNSQKPLDALVELDDNELDNVIWTTEVAGCPAPMCADSSCRIGIPQGHSCPTCVCKKQRRQP